MKKKSLLLIVIIILSFSLIEYFLFAVPEPPNKNNPYLEYVRVRNLTISVRTLGTLEAKKSHMISSQIKGSGAKIIFLAENGAFVSKGEILVQFDPKPFEDTVQELENKTETLAAAVKATQQLVEWEKNEAEQRIVSAEYQNKIAKLDLKRLTEGEGPLKLAQYKDEYDKAALELNHHQAYERDLHDLEKEGISSQVELGRVRENIKIFQEKYKSTKRQFDSYEKYVLPVILESAKAKVKSTELAIQQIKQSSVHKIANAAATYQQSQAMLKAVRLSLEKSKDELLKTSIRAPFDGIIIHYETYRDGEVRMPREGDTVIVNQPILYFPDISNLIVKSRIREVDLHQIRLGQLATIYVDAYPDEKLEGKLSFIGALAKKKINTVTSDKYFQVIFSLNESNEHFRPGMSAKIIVHVADLKEIATIPIHSVFQDKEGEFCYLWNGVMYEKRYVTIGRQNEDYVEVIKGLEVGDAVSQIQPENIL